MNRPDERTVEELLVQAIKGGARGANAIDLVVNTFELTGSWEDWYMDIGWQDEYEGCPCCSFLDTNVATYPGMAGWASPIFYFECYVCGFSYAEEEVIMEALM